MKVNQIPFSLLSIEAVQEMATQCGSTIGSRHTDDPLLSAPLAALDNPKQQATLAIASSQKQALTDQVNEADLKRDRGFIAFRKHVEADQYNDWNPGIKEAANRVMSIIQKHGARLYNEGLTVQSALMTSLFADLDAPQAQTDLTTLNLTECINQLKAMQTDFATLFQQRNELQSARNIPTKAEAKTALAQSLGTLLGGLDFLAASQPNSPYAQTHVLTSEIIGRIVTSERQR